MSVGVHLGLGAGYEEALLHAQQLRCSAVQVFTHSPRTFAFKPLEPKRQQVLLDGWKRLGIKTVVSHTSYLINIGAQDNRKFYGALGILRNEIIYAEAFGCQYAVLHPGKHLDEGTAKGVAQIARGLGKLRETLEQTRVMVLLETAAGQGSEVGSRIEELHDIIMSVEPAVRERLGVCLDTAHLFAAGYDIRTAQGVESLISAIERTFGLSRVRLVHVNDSVFDLGSRRDRHEHIGQGRIGLDGLRRFLNHPKIKGLPMVLETPIDERGDQHSDIAALRSVLK